MNQDDETYELIEAYLNGELKGHGLQAFEDRLKQESVFQEKVNNHKLANLLVKKKGLIDIKTLIEKEDKTARNYDKVKNTGIALVAALIIWGVWSYYTTENKTSALDIPNPVEIKPIDLSAPVISHSAPNLQENSAVARKKTASESAKQLTENQTNIQDKHEEIPVLNNNEPEKVLQKEVLSDKPTSQEQKAIIPIYTCEHTVLEAHITVDPACKDVLNGSIHVSGIRGGKAPYKTEVFSKNDLVSSQNLEAGNYAVLIKDANQCARKWENIQVKETDCTKDFSLNPFIGDQWEIPVYSSTGTLTIYDEIGNVYFRREIAAGAKEKWTGYSSSGELKTGFFPFVIKYSDGTSKDGSVSIGK